MFHLSGHLSGAVKVVKGAAKALASGATKKLAGILKKILKSSFDKLVRAEPWLQPLQKYFTCVVVDILTSFKSLSSEEFKAALKRLTRTVLFDIKKGANPSTFKGDSGYLLQAGRDTITRLLLLRVFPAFPELLQWLDEKGDTTPQQLENWCSMASAVVPMSHHLFGGTQQIRVIAPNPDRDQSYAYENNMAKPNPLYATHTERSRVATWYIVRTRQEHLMGLKYGLPGKAHKWVTCLDELYRQYDARSKKGAANRAKYPTFEDYLKDSKKKGDKFLFPPNHKKSKTEKRLFPSGHPLQRNCKAILREKRDPLHDVFPNRTWYEKKFETASTRFKGSISKRKTKAENVLRKMMHWNDVNNDIYPTGIDAHTKLKWVGCTTRFRLEMNRCTTCCCRGGLFQTVISHQLVQGPRTECGPFFSTTDAIARIVISGLRIFFMTNTYAHTCFTTAVLRNGSTGVRLTSKKEQQSATRKNQRASNPAAMRQQVTKQALTSQERRAKAKGKRKGKRLRL